jgi:AcrR family transcriptional regulator
MSPKTKKQFEEMREEKRALIMDVALEHFAGVGFHATTINHIARHAGISKGLMYNYFKSKEELLSEIISRSVNEIFVHFDPDRDGFLSENEFEHFIRKLTASLREKRMIWRLFFQMMMQKEVREKILTLATVSDKLQHSGTTIGDMEFIPQIFRMISEYFERKRDKMGKGYDPELEMNIFMIHIKGFAVTYIYTDEDDDLSFKKTTDRIIEIYK